MKILLMISTSVFIISIILYLYFFTQRKKHNVVVQMWLTIIVGMVASLAVQLIRVNGDLSGGSIQLSFFLYLALIIYSVWKLSVVLKK